MKRFSFVHAADLHLDSPFKGISELSNELRGELTEATFSAFNKIIDFCIEKQVDFLLISGDIYDGADKSLRAQLRFRDGLKRLTEAGINAYIAHGNHDPLSGWSANLDWPKNIHIFCGDSVEEVIFEKDGEKIAQLYGISYPKRDIKANLALQFPPKTENSPFTIGVLHCNVGSDTGHEPYAPCTLDDLLSKKYDYWALGHIHKKTILNDGDPLVVYPGDPQGLNPKETGPKGCFLVNVDEKGCPAPAFIAVDSIRWFKKELSIESLHTEQELITEMYDSIEKIREEADGRSSICRIILSGRSSLHSVITRKGILDDLAKGIRETEEGEKRFVWLDSIVDNTYSEIDRESLLEREDFISDLVNLFEEISENTDRRSDIRASLDPLFTSNIGRKILESFDDEQLIDLMKKAETLCLDVLVRSESA